MVAMETVTNQYLGGDTSLACSAETQSKIDAQVVELVRKQHEKALTILKDNRGKRHCAIPRCGAKMKNGRYEASWVDEAEALSAILDDDW